MKALTAVLAAGVVLGLAGPLGLARAVEPIAPPIRFEIVRQRDGPVIGRDHPDARGNEFGFEDGVTVKIGSVYHLIVGEMVGEPFWQRMRIAHWTSPDAVHWHRQGTLRETSGAPHARTGLPYDSVWGANVVFDQRAQRWNLFYVGYDQGGSSGGRIRRAVSSAPGYQGIGGPYTDVGIALQPDAHSQPWEGDQGTDSFCPYRVGRRWLALYGSHDGSKSVWSVGLAGAPELAGPWMRLPTGNPLVIEPVMVENPIVTPIGRSSYVAVYDRDVTGPSAWDAQNVGFTYSADGVHWSLGGLIPVQPEGPARWSNGLRTPLGLVPEGGGVFTLLYTAEIKQGNFWAVGLVRLKLKSAVSTGSPHSP